MRIQKINNKQAFGYGNMDPDILKSLPPSVRKNILRTTGELEGLLNGNWDPSIAIDGKFKNVSSSIFEEEALKNKK